MTVPPPAPRPRAALDLALFVVAPLALLAWVVVGSLGWRARHDLPMMMYQAFLQDRFGLVPYRDFFDMNLPGTYATYRLIGAVFGYGDLGLRLADVAWMAAVGGLAVALVRRVSGVAAVAGATLFLLQYLAWGGEITLQRELLALVPVGLGLLAATSAMPLRRRAFLVGLAFGVAMTYKPHLVLGAGTTAVWLGLEAWRTEGRRGVLGGLVAGTVGLALPLGLVVAVLGATGLLADFRHSLGYLPYYAGISGEHEAIAGGARLAYLAQRTFALGGYAGWVLLAALGYAHALYGVAHEGLRRRVGLLAALLATYCLYPAFSGQFWPYHWLPMVFFASLGAGLLLVPVDGAPEVPAWRTWGGRAALGVGLLVLARGEPDGWNAPDDLVPELGNPDRIAAYLRDHLRPGDTVQPFDWIQSGVVHGLLLAEARAATPFVYTFHFYHHVSDPYIQDLRARFVADLQAAPPRFVVMGKVHWPFVTGADATTSFPAFDTFLAERYRVVASWPETKVEIWERVDEAGAP